MVEPLTMIAAGSSIASSLGSLFGKKKAKTVDQSKPYFRPVNETLNDVDKTLDYLKSTQNFTERPMRAMTQDEMNDPIFKQNAVMDIKNYFDKTKVDETLNTDPYANIDFNKAGRQYVQDYIKEGNLNPAYAQTLQNRNFDYEGIVKAVIEARKMPHMNTSSHDLLTQQGLGLALGAAGRIK
jgi:hypothetical protein